MSRSNVRLRAVKTDSISRLRHARAIRDGSLVRYTSTQQIHSLSLAWRQIIRLFVRHEISNNFVVIHVRRLFTCFKHMNFPCPSDASSYAGHFPCLVAVDFGETLRQLFPRIKDAPSCAPPEFAFDSQPRHGRHAVTHYPRMQIIPIDIQNVLPTLPCRRWGSSRTTGATAAGRRRRNARRGLGYCGLNRCWPALLLDGLAPGAFSQRVHVIPLEKRCSEVTIAGFREYCVSDPGLAPAPALDQLIDLFRSVRREHVTKKTLQDPRRRGWLPPCPSALQLAHQGRQVRQQHVFKHAEGRDLNQRTPVKSFKVNAHQPMLLRQRRSSQRGPDFTSYRSP